MILLPEEQEKKTNDGGDAIIEKEGDEEDLFSRLKNKPWGPSSNPYSVEIGGGNCDVYISDENGKININGIKDDTREGFIKFLTSLTISEIDADTITGSILDWVDKDSLHHINGAESDYYATLPDPYEAKNGPFETIEELALVKGVTPKIYEMLREHVTMYGSGKINVNYASREVLQYVPLITPEIAEGIITLREEQGKIKEFGELKELFRSFGIVGSNFHKILDFLTVYDSNYVTINSISSADGIQNSYKMIVLKGIQHFRIVAVYPE
ncbi:MAG: general secretion pathway protein GspK [Candidatus Brocadiaceae bacterium]|nr:general secretion pathway protein GspK [Candidatus Brocadiaceae bacterium]